MPIDYDKVTVTHIMADGSVRDSVKDYDIPFEKLPYVVQEFMREAVIKRCE